MSLDGRTLARVADDARVTTTIVGLLIAFCALLLAKWLAVVAIAALVLLAVLRFAVRRIVRAVRARREARAASVPASVSGSSVSGSSVAAPSVSAGSSRRATSAVTPAVALRPVTPGPTCSWCGLVGGHHDHRGRPVRPRHAHAGALTRM